MAIVIVSSSRLFVALALLTVSVSLAESSLAAENSVKECAAFKTETEKLVEMVLVASEIRYEEAKKQPPTRCLSFKDRILKVALSKGLIEASQSGDNLDGYKQMIRMIETRTECLEKASRMNGAGLRSLLSFMNECAKEIGSNQSTNPQLVEQLEAANRELRAQLAAKEALLQQISDTVDRLLGQPAKGTDEGQVKVELAENKLPIFDKFQALDKQNKLCKNQLRHLASANQAQYEQLSLKNEAETISNSLTRKLRDGLDKVRMELKQMTLERNYQRRLAEDNASQLRICQTYSGMQSGV